MSRLIDRAELFNRLANIKAPPEANEYKAEVYSLIQSMETADEIMPEGLVICSPSTAEHVEIVVRCKECKYCEDGWHFNIPMHTCELGNRGESVQPDDFCSYGERREP